jgi:hypothetical protein
MHGSQRIEKKNVLWSRVLKSDPVKQYLASFAVGVFAGIIVSAFRLNLGMPGHKALFWMVPVLTMRMIGKTKGGVSVGAAAVLLTTYGTAGHLGGGPFGMPLILLGAVILDSVIGFLERKRFSFAFYTATVSLAAMICNLLCMVKKLFVSDGFGVHLLLNNSSFWFRFASYAFWGLISGVIACFMARYYRRKR